MAAGLAATCVIGAAAGLYLRPNLETGRAPDAPAADQAPLTRVSDTPAEAPPPGEAARLQTQLQMLVLGGVAPSASATGQGPPQTAPSSAPAAMDGTPALLPSRSAAPAAAEPLTGRPASKGLTLASRSPGAVVLPRPSRPSAATGRESRAPASSDGANASAAPQPVRVAAVEAPTPAVSEPSRRAEGPTYDCGRARSSAERMVCASPELAALDRNMAAELEAAVAAGHSPRELARDQASWRRRRDRAAPDPQAVADQYRQRIGQLRSMQ